VLQNYNPVTEKIQKENKECLDLNQRRRKKRKIFRKRM
jgi:hypothetical protein